MIVSAMLSIHATDDGARGESEMKASLAEVFTLTVVPLFELLEVHQTSQRCDEEGLQRCVSLFNSTERKLYACSIIDHATYMQVECAWCAERGCSCSDVSNQHGAPVQHQIQGWMQVTTLINMDGR